MIFISRYTNFRLTLRGEHKKVVHAKSGAEEVFRFPAIVVEFVNATYDTKRWQELTQPDAPDNLNIIKSEDDLIRLMRDEMKRYGGDFFERPADETKDQRRARLQAELDGIDAEESKGVSGETEEDTPPSRPSAKKGKGSSKSKVLL